MVVEIGIWRNVGPDLFKSSALPAVLQEAVNPSHEVIEHSNVDVMQNISAVEVICFNMKKIPKNKRNGSCTGGMEPIFDSLQRLAIIGPLCVLELTEFSFDTLEVGTLHVVSKPLYDNSPAASHFAIRTWPQGTSIDVTSLRKLPQWVKYYLGYLTKDLRVHISLNSWAGSGNSSQFRSHQ
ncbi:hypothetical protein BDD12DRAFT_806503 [Trichophaea hybrida]|nr:hypothetical protein BDD12DRAFT_806503 [Trichophaea hybrida]